MTADPELPPRRERIADAASLAVVAAVLVVPLAGLWHYQGPSMEEGHMLSFPAEVLKGNVANRDFLHLYGPGSLWVLAGAFKVFGTTLATERAIGWLQHALLAFGLWALVRPVGRWWAATAGALSALIVITPVGLAAMAWNGAIAAGAWAVALGARSVAASGRGDERRATWLSAGAGVCAGVALLYRPDLVLAVGAALALLWWHSQRRQRLWMLGATFATSALVLIHVAMAGVAASWTGMFVEPVFELRAGRSLPVPPSWDRVDGYFQKSGLLRTEGWPFPMIGVPKQIVVWFWLSVLVTIGLVVAAWWMGRDERVRALPPTLGLRAGALYAALLVSQILQRPDSAHLAWVTTVSFPVALAVGVVVARAVRPAWAERTIAAIAAAGLAALLFVAIPFFPVRAYVDVVSHGLRGDPFGFRIERDGRTFYLADADAARAAQEVVDRLGEELTPGEVLVESPIDLSRTVYSDAYVYYLFPELEVGTHFIEMDPGVSNARDSGFAEEVANADWLILTRRWEAWEESNDARVPGDPRPNRIVERDFCVELDAGAYVLMRRCDSRR